MSPELRRGDKCGCRELKEFRRGGIEIRGLNSGEAKRRGYVEIGEIKRRISNNGSDFIPLVMRLGWPKEVEDMIAIVERGDGDETEDEGQGSLERQECRWE